MTFYSGFLIGLPDSETPADLSIKPDQISKGDRNQIHATMERDGNIFGFKHWHRYKLLTEREFFDNPERNVRIGSLLQYEVLTVMGDGKALLLAETKDIANYVIDELLRRTVFPNFRRIEIILDDLIDSCSKPDSDYLITILHGSYAGNDADLKRASFYGADLTGSKLVRENRKLFNFYTCGVERRVLDGLPTISGREGESLIARLGNDGFVSATLSNRNRALELGKLINYIASNRWLSSWVKRSMKEDL
ncbi:hypothetical protein AB838_15820 [Rhodobacteraceae bacterium (ex Bugula neritina AB1)]|nr:hypothetical protein AB838_15820 [Rhodobacteraceae bacterium (ex Bugula neritina AB1)]